MRLLAFLQAWDLLRDEVGGTPTLEVFAERFGIPLPAVETDFLAFQTAFGTDDPSQVLDLLWGWHDSRVKGSPKLPIGIR